MKRILTIIFLLLLQQPSRAQMVIFNEQFDEFPGYALTGWYRQFSGMVPWQVGIPDQVGGCMPPVGGPMSLDDGINKVACITDCGNFDYNNSDVLTGTPPIDLTGITGAWLRYDSYFEGYSTGTNTEKATVEISADGGTTWTVLQNVPANPLSNFKTWYIDLSAYSNMSNIRIGFRYSDGGGYMYGWAIDNIQVFKPARKDLALLSVTPLDELLSYVAIGSGYTHHALVYNAGLDTVTSFKLHYRQGSGTV